MKDLTIGGPNGFGFKDIKISYDRPSETFKAGLSLSIPNIGGRKDNPATPTINEGTSGIGATLGFKSGKLDSISLDSKDLNIQTSIPLLFLHLLLPLSFCI